MHGKLFAILSLTLILTSAHADVNDAVDTVADSNLVGAYTPANRLDDNLKQAADFAATQIGQGDLVEIVSAESQVVAGTNYRFKLIIAMGDGTQHLFSAIVFKPLPNTGEDGMQLIEYQDLGVNPTVQ